MFCTPRTLFRTAASGTFSGGLCGPVQVPVTMLSFTVLNVAQRLDLGDKDYSHMVPGDTEFIVPSEN